VVANIWGVTIISLAKAALNQYSSQAVASPNQENEVYMRLQSIFAKNKYGYNTRFMSDFDRLLDAALNERFLDESALYYEDPVVQKEIEDMEFGLTGEFAESDIKNLLKDPSSHDAAHKSLRYPDRVGSNYRKSDDLSCYKVHPKAKGPSF